MTLTQKKQTTAQKARSALDRIDTLERVIQNMANQYTLLVQQLDKRIDENSTFVNALNEVVGPEKVVEQVQKTKDEETQVRIDETQRRLQEALDNGELELAQTVEKHVLLVCERLDDNGEVVPRSRFFHTLEQLIPEIQSLVLGKVAGDIVEIKNQETVDKLLVVGVYKNTASPEEANT